MYKKTALILCILFILAACGKKEIKPVSRESRTALSSFKLADTIRQDFIDKNLAAIRLKSTEKGYSDVTAADASFDALDLDFTPKWVEIDGTKVTLNISWTSSWVIGGHKKKDSGLAVFVMEGRPLKLVKIERANPFIPPAD